MNPKFVALPFFPDTIPTPVGEKKRHAGRIETRMDSGHVNSRPDPMNTFDYFEYTWSGIAKAHFESLQQFYQKYTGQPISGWLHPGAEGEWIVAFAEFLMPKQTLHISPGETTEIFDCVIRVRILKAGTI